MCSSRCRVIMIDQLLAVHKVYSNKFLQPSITTNTIMKRIPRVRKKYNSPSPRVMPKVLPPLTSNLPPPGKSLGSAKEMDGVQGKRIVIKKTAKQPRPTSNKMKFTPLTPFAARNFVTLSMNPGPAGASCTGGKGGGDETGVVATISASTIAWAGAAAMAGTLITPG